jgi:hypothetical protein
MYKMDKKTLFAVFALFALTAQVTAMSYGIISIYKFNDSNGNGIKDRMEKGMTGSFTIQGTNGFYKNVEISKNNKIFTVLVMVPRDATYTVTENVPASYVSSTRNPQTALIKRECKCKETACGLAVLLKFGTKRTVTTTTTTTTSSTTTTTIPPEKQLTSANLLSCAKGKKTHVQTDTTIDCFLCFRQRDIFYNETIAPVGPGKDAYDQLNVEGASGFIPRWEFRMNGTDVIVNGCKTFPELNEILFCGLIPLPGYPYKIC